MTSEAILKAVKEAREKGGKRNFSQSFDLSIALKGMDMKKPENRIKVEIALPKGIGKELKIGAFLDALIPAAKNLENVVIIKKDEIEGYARDKKSARSLAKQCFAFLSEAPLMPTVGRAFGPVLAVRNKMPKPIPPNLPDLAGFVKRLRGTIRLAVKESPVLNCIVGSEKMVDGDIAENVEAVVKAVEGAVPKGKEQIRTVYLKLTMGEPVKVGQDG